MTEFTHPFDYVLTTLAALQESGAKLRAPRSSLERLAQGGTVTARRIAEPAPSVEEQAEIRPSLRRDAAPVESSPLPAPRELPPYEPIAPATGTKSERLAAMRGPILACTKCPNLVGSRTQVVFGVGNPEAELMFVGEAPGEDEDLEGEPFVGRAGQLLTKIIETMGFGRDKVYIANVLKCRPNMPPGVTGNRKPLPAEMQTCLPYLREQIEVIQPRALVALGATALEGLTGQTLSVGKMRGRWMEFQGIPLMVTFHPAYLLRNQAVTEKRKVWEDMLLVLKRLGHAITEKQRGYFLKA
jgi:uracil-DNA glycosylase family 4